MQTTRRGFLHASAAVAAVASSTGFARSSVPALGRVSAKGPDLLDGEGRHVLLRGAVTVTSSFFSDEPGAELHTVDLGDADYEHMRSLGFSVQSIRLESCRVGATLECQAQDAYLQKLENWVSAAEKTGIYTMFKMTIYDSPSWARKAFKPERWQEFWDNKDGQQDAHLAGWKVLWTHFRGRKSVVGYDILNEPSIGDRTGDAFNRDHLFPYYRKASKALRAIDTEAALMFQAAPLVVHDHPKMRLEKLDDPHPVFIAHLYPNPLANAGREALLFEKLAGEHNYPVHYDEFGYPDKAAYGIPAWTPESEMVMADIFDQSGRGWTRPWYVHTPTLSLLNPDGSDAPKMNYLARPCPLRAAGKPDGWNFDFATHDFTVKLRPAPMNVSAASEIFVARKRQYPNGLTISLDGRAVATIAADDTLTAAHPAITYRGDGEILCIPAKRKPVEIQFKALA